MEGNYVTEDEVVRKSLQLKLVVTKNELKNIFVKMMSEEQKSGRESPKRIQPKFKSAF